MLGTKALEVIGKLEELDKGYLTLEGQLKEEMNKLKDVNLEMRGVYDMQENLETTSSNYERLYQALEKRVFSNERTLDV